MRSSSLPARSRDYLERAQPLLGTFVSIRVDNHHPNASAAVSAAFTQIADVQRRMSFHDPDSELSRINRHAHDEPQRVSSSLHRVLSAALALARASHGRFDSCVAGQLVAWGQLPRPAAHDVDPRADWRDVILLDDGRVQFRRRLWLDLGGIAKGYAVDCAIAILRRRGLASGCVNAGGDLRVFGRMESVHVRDPADPGRRLPILQISNAATATSAGYFSQIGGHTALVDPVHGTSLGHRCSVTVCARRAIWADALTKVVLANPTRAAPLLRRLQASAMILNSDGTRRTVN